MAGKLLKFDIKLMYGIFKRNMKGCVDDFKKSWSEFGQNMKKSTSFGDMSNALFRLGKEGYLALIKLTGPYGKIIQYTIALTVGLRLVCKEYEKVEKAALRASNAFKTGGRMGTGNFSKYQNKAKELSQNGTITQDEAMTGMASIAQNNHSLDEKTVDRLLNTSKDAAAFLGGDYASTLGKLGDILDDTTTSYETLRSVGLEFTKAEVEQIKALKESYRQTEANAIILAKMEDVYKGAEEAQKNTLSGQFQTFVNQWKSVVAQVGKALAPIHKLIFSLLNPIMEILQIVGELLTPIGKIFDMVVSISPKLGMLQGIIDSIKSAVKNVVSALSDLLSPLLGAESASKSMGEFWRIVGREISFNIRWVSMLLSMFIKIIKFALMPYIACFKLISGLIQRIGEGFKKGFGGSQMLDLPQKLLGLWNKITSVIEKLFDIIINNPIIQFLGKVVEMLSYIVGLLVGKIMDAVCAIFDYANKAIDGLCGALKEAYFRFWEALGFDMSEERAAYEREKNQSNNNNNSGSGDNWQDPRMNFRAAFETAGSMSQRIQTNIMQKNSPQAKMVEYLSSINEKLSSVTDSQKQQNEAQTQQLAIMGAQYKATKEINLGFT